MNGHQHLIAMRRAGHVPAGVWLTDGKDRDVLDWYRRPNPHDGLLYPAVQVDQDDIPEALDLRYVVGLDVHIAGQRSDARTKRLFHAVRAEKPRIAIACLTTETLIYDRRIHG